METAGSVFKQTYPHLEWLLIDDGSTDGTIELVHQMAAKDPRVRLVHNPTAGSPGQSRGLGFKQSSGEWIAFLDADDLWLPEKLEEQLNFAMTNNYDFTFHGYRRINVDNSSVGRYLSSAKEVGVSRFLSQRPIGNLTVMLKRNLLNGFEFPIGSNEDFRLWLQILRKGHVAHFLDKDLARYRIVPSSRGANKKNMAREIFRIYWEDQDLRFDQKLFYFSLYAFNSALKYSRF